MKTPQKRTFLLVSALVMVAVVGTVAAQTAYQAKAEITYNITPDLTVSLPATLAFGSTAAGTSGTNAWSNGFVLDGTNAYAYTISAQLNGTFSAFSALEIQFSNSGGPVCTLTLSAPTCSFVFSTPQDEQWNVVASWTAATVTTALSSATDPVSLVVSTTGP